HPVSTRRCDLEAPSLRTPAGELPPRPLTASLAPSPRPLPLVATLRAPVERGRRLVGLPRLPQVIVRAAVAALAAPDLVVDGPDLHLELGGVLDDAKVAELVVAPLV